jgi:hypothetical protein
MASPPFLITVLEGRMKWEITFKMNRKRFTTYNPISNQQQIRYISEDWTFSDVNSQKWCIPERLFFQDFGRYVLPNEGGMERERKKSKKRDLTEYPMQKKEKIFTKIILEICLQD